MAYVLGVDVGTTRIRCFAIDKEGRSLSSHFTGVEVLHPQPGYSEIDPECLWQGFKDVVSTTIGSGHLDPSQASCLGITCQRNTFLLWNRSTSQPLCNLITWQDRRADEVCKLWNSSMQFKFLKLGGGFLHLISRSKRFLAASIVTLTTQQVAPRLYWALNNVEGAKKLANEENLCYGTVDTWILWKLTNGSVHATDYSHVSPTLLFDPFQMKYSDTIINVLGFPRSIFPEIKDTGGLFGHVAAEHFGAAIPITGVISDQTSATFAQGCWEPGDLKCTLGTGWKIGSELIFLAEANFPSSGSVCEWGARFSLFSDPSETEAIAESVQDSNGVCFVPAFDGIQAPYNDPRATASVIGITHSTTKEHLVRAMLESLAFTFKQIYDVAQGELSVKIKQIRVDGGVTKNNFVLQTISNLLGKTVERPTDVDMTVYGAIYIAGLSSGFWKSRDEIKSLWKLDRCFVPKTEDATRATSVQYRLWQKAVERSLEWYDQIENGDEN
ncbi:putative glycerol kinase 5 isoform X2 [Halichondria panicea]|uniref:putative glycerol kinase 5 isoform X2 n=1 Tax=Halichondria panicea TaxID=6063 RepID=UPI00312B54A4